MIFWVEKVLKDSTMSCEAPPEPCEVSKEVRKIWWEQISSRMHNLLSLGEHNFLYCSPVLGVVKGIEVSPSANMFM